MCCRASAVQSNREPWPKVLPAIGDSARVSTSVMMAELWFLRTSRLQVLQAATSLRAQDEADSDRQEVEPRSAEGLMRYWCPRPELDVSDDN